MRDLISHAFPGSIPLRQLVYRVHPLPESMRPLVWDFGQLTDHTEELYTAQIVRRLMESPAAGVSIVTDARVFFSYRGVAADSNTDSPSFIC